MCFPDELCLSMCEYTCMCIYIYMCTYINLYTEYTQTEDVKGRLLYVLHHRFCFINKLLKFKIDQLKCQKP